MRDGLSNRSGTVCLQQIRGLQEDKAKPFWMKVPHMQPLTSACRDRLERLISLAQGFDRSWSFSAQDMEERALFFMPATQPAQQALETAAATLGFETAGLQDFQHATAGADALGLTLSKNGSVRLYTQYWDALAAQVQQGDLTPAPLYLGLKRLAGGRARRDVYYCLPMAPQTEYRPQIETALLAFGAAAGPVHRLLDQLTPETCIWTRTQGAGRQSWLATVRRAQIAAQDVIDALAPVATRAGVPEVIAALRKGALLHIAGGQDDIKGTFLTFYVETDQTGLREFLQKFPA